MNNSTYAEALKHLSRNDAVLRKLIHLYSEPTITKHVKYYDELVSSIISQQLSVKAAATIYKRFCSLFNAETCPNPEQIIAESDDALRSAGLSRQKISYIKDLAQKVINREIVFDKFEKLSNEEIIKELTAVKGIGEWTVHMFLIFCMNRLNVLPVGDLGVRTAITRQYGLKSLATPHQIKDIALKGNWSPYESIASWYLWRSLENKEN